MKEAGFNADKGRAVFESYYDECIDNSEFWEKAKKAGFRLELMAAAVAHLKTSKYLGVKEKAAYDIRTAWGLTDEEYVFVAAKLSSNLKTYHIEDSGVPDPKEQQAIDDMATMPKAMHALKKFCIVSGVMFLVALSIFIISSIRESRPLEYQIVDVKVSGVYSETVTSTNSDGYSENTFTYSVYIEDAGSEYSLSGITRADLDYLRTLRDNEQSISVYKANGGYYYTESSVLHSRPSYSEKVLSGTATIPLLLIFLFSITVYILFSRDPAKYRKCKELDRRRRALGRELGLGGDGSMPPLT